MPHHKGELDVDLAVNGLSSVTDLLRFALTGLRYAFGWLGGEGGQSVAY